MSDRKDYADEDKAMSLDVAVAEAATDSRYEAILVLLEAHPAGLSVHRINELLNRAGVRITSDGQVLHRLKTLERRQRVEKVDGPNGSLWKVS